MATDLSPNPSPLRGGESRRRHSEKRMASRVPLALPRPTRLPARHPLSPMGEGGWGGEVSYGSIPRKNTSTDVSTIVSHASVRESGSTKTSRVRM
jgi:hypothetical protein